MRDEAQDESDDAHVQHKRVDQQQANDAGASPRDFAHREMNERQNHAEQRDDDHDHVERPPSEIITLWASEALVRLGWLL